MNINRNVVANALIISAVTIGGGATATAGVLKSGTPSNSTRTVSTRSTKYTSVTRTTEPSHKIVTGNDTTQ